MAASTDFILYFLFLYLFPDIPTSPIKALSYICGNIVSFLGHRTFVFNAQRVNAKKQILPFIVLYALTFLLNNVTNEVSLNLFENRLISWFIATSVSTIVNFLGMKTWVFKS